MLRQASATSSVCAVWKASPRISSGSETAVIESHNWFSQDSTVRSYSADRREVFSGDSGAEVDLGGLADLPVTDPPVDAVRGRVRQVGVEEARRPPRGQQPPAEFRHQRGRVSSPATV